MKKKFYITMLTVFAVTLFSFTYIFAANDMNPVDGIRNVVGGAENVVEDAGKGVVDGIKDVTSAGENTVKDVTDNAGDKMKDAENRTIGSMTTDNDNYTSTRTTTRAATDNNEGTFLGMNSTVWTWLIMAVVGIAIVALVWMYAKQNNRSYNE